MFICKNCKSVDKFELMFDEDYRGNKEYSYYYDKNSNVVIEVNGYIFKPDLFFMNNHAVCRYCGQIYIWDYKS